MKTYHIAVLVGSIRRESLNRKLADALIKLAPADFTFHHLKIDDLPLYNEDDDEDPPEAVRRLKQEIAEANGLLIATPEYNRSIPGLLKNAIDHGSRPRGQNSWGGKPAGMIGLSPSPCGTALAQQHLRSILAVLDVPTMAQPEGYIQHYEELFDTDGGIGEGSQKFLQGWMDRFAAWVRLCAGVKKG
ncbi:MAG TPA: NAD(P)H-dependent oxidoreductase [Chlorobaculum parvum]|uniref:NAD(P)H-dependent oxidoreductase n=1 Tax=Chlorobaculum parvum TaxID=274539 RepID=A0A7C5DF53_9CHLB|nr:NAD(P)H-dependent oxidoreductase [Chlorobaculum parvum]